MNSRALTDWLTMDRHDREAVAARLCPEYQQTGDLTLRDHVFHLFHPLVRITVLRLPHPWQETDDLSQEGSMALLTAIAEYNPTLPEAATFQTFAIGKIKWRCLEYLRHRVWGTRLAQTARKAYDKRQYEIACGAELTVEEKLTGGPTLPPWAEPPVSFSNVVMHHHSEMEKVRLIDAVTNAIDCEFEALNALVRGDLHASVGKLPPREQAVVVAYFWEGLTFKSIGERLRISESRVFQLVAQAKVRLKKGLQHYAGEPEFQPAPQGRPARIVNRQTVPQHPRKRRAA